MFRRTFILVAAVRPRRDCWLPSRACCEF